MTKDKRQAIIRHITNLRIIFPALRPQTDEVDLYRKLVKLESEGHRHAERCCNEPVSEEEDKRIEAVILDRLDSILGFRAAKVPVFLNGDPRGYALKIKETHMRSWLASNVHLQTDLGGYGLIAPEF